MSGSRILIVNADDFGRSPGINAGIIRAHRQGIVTSTTLMVNMPWSASAVHEAEEVPGLAVGLHLNFCYGRPVSVPTGIGSLVDESGSLLTSTDEQICGAEASDIHTEAMAQLERFQSLTGRMPSHLDSHKYLHSFEPFRSVVASIAASTGLPARATSEDDRAALSAAGVVTTDYFEGRFHGLDGVGVEQSVLDMALKQLRPGVTELMCHPGFVDEHLQDSSYALDRERELDVLSSGETKCLIACSRVKLATFHEL